MKPTFAPFARPLYVMSKPIGSACNLNDVAWRDTVGAEVIDSCKGVVDNLLGCDKCCH